MSKKLQESKSHGPHSQLAKWEGQWKGITKVWFEPGDPVDISETTGTIRPVLDGMFMQHNYESSMMNKPLKGMALYGQHLQDDVWQCAWIDSFHMGTGILHSIGQKGDQVFNVTGHYNMGAGQPNWGWRTSIHMPSYDILEIRMYNIDPAGNEALAVETIYHRF